jgi:hypothetical protein
MKTNIMNHAFSPFLAENQRPMSFQKYDQMPRGINKAISKDQFGKISKGGPYKTLTPYHRPVSIPSKVFHIGLRVDAA